jgi:hypothetical protein
MFDGSDWLSSSIIGRIRENLSVGRFFGDEEKGQKGKSHKYVNDLFCSMFLDFRFVLETPLDVSRKREK